jgi:hypothetical protein
LSFLATFGGVLVGDGGGEVTIHLNGVPGGPWRKSDLGGGSGGKRERNNPGGGGGWLDGNWGDWVVIVIERAVVMPRRAGRVAMGTATTD